MDQDAANRNNRALSLSASSSTPSLTSSVAAAKLRLLLPARLPPGRQWKEGFNGAALGSASSSLDVFLQDDSGKREAMKRHWASNSSSPTHARLPPRPQSAATMRRWCTQGGQPPPTCP